MLPRNMDFFFCYRKPRKKQWVDKRGDEGRVGEGREGEKRRKEKRREDKRRGEERRREVRREERRREKKRRGEEGREEERRQEKRRGEERKEERREEKRGEERREELEEHLFRSSVGWDPERMALVPGSSFDREKTKFPETKFLTQHPGPTSDWTLPSMTPGLDTSCRCGHMSDPGGTYRKLSGAVVCPVILYHAATQVSNDFSQQSMTLELQTTFSAFYWPGKTNYIIYSKTDGDRRALAVMKTGGQSMESCGYLPLPLVLPHVHCNIMGERMDQ
ncbi:hypothetical protein STEG23_013770, partial [Scotinomys teguina]